MATETGAVHSNERGRNLEQWAADRFPLDDVALDNHTTRGYDAILKDTLVWPHGTAFNPQVTIQQIILQEGDRLEIKSASTHINYGGRTIPGRYYLPHATLDTADAVLFGITTPDGRVLPQATGVLPIEAVERLCEAYSWTAAPSNRRYEEVCRIGWPQLFDRVVVDDLEDKR